MGERAHGEILSIAFAGKGQHQDAGGKIIHAAPNTTSNIFAKSISKDGGRGSLPRPARGRQGRPRLEVEGRLRRAAPRRALALGHLPDDPDRRGRRQRRPRGDGLEGRRGAALLPDVAAASPRRRREADRQRLRRADHQGAADGVRGRDEPPDRAADGGLRWLARVARPSSSRPSRAAPGWEFTDISASTSRPTRRLQEEDAAPEGSRRCSRCRARSRRQAAQLTCPTASSSRRQRLAMLRFMTTAMVYRPW